MLNWRDPHSPLAGGAERVSINVLSELVQRGHECWWFAREFKGCEPSTTIKGVHVIRRGTGLRSSIEVLKWHRKFPRPEPLPESHGKLPRFDLVIDQHHGIPWYAPWWCGTRCVALIHEVLGPIWKSFYRWPLRTLGRWQEALTLRLYRNVPFWTVSDSTAGRLHALGVRDVTVLPNGCDTVPEGSLAEKRMGVGIPLRLCVLSRLAPNKQVGHAILVTKLLHERGIGVTLAVVGDGEEKENLIAFAHKLGVNAHVTFYNQVSEEAKLVALRASHLLLHCSVREGWGLNVIEAAAMGTPAIVYPVDGLRDSVLNDITGVHTAGPTPEAMATAIVRLINAPQHYQELRTRAWRHSFDFQWTKVLPLACDWLLKQAYTSR